MGSRSVSPGGALLRSSRMFSLPKPLPEPPAQQLHSGQFKSDTMTRHRPQYQAITSPLSSREKGDWGFKRPFPLKSTMATSTPLIRVKNVDTIENITDFTSAADLTMSLEKFQELRVALSVPTLKDDGVLKSRHGTKSVFEEDSDITDIQKGKANDKRWKFLGPWLATMSEGEFAAYLMKQVRPRRRAFREMLKAHLAATITQRQNNEARELGETPPAKVLASNITSAQLLDHLRWLRAERSVLYDLISKFMDLPPLSKPKNSILDDVYRSSSQSTPTATSQSPYGVTGPPPSHPSAGISYLRTGSFMENHPVYGPQARATPALARVVSPRIYTAPAKLGVGGFVVNAPGGDTSFNVRYGRVSGGEAMLKGISHLDTTTLGGAKAFVDVETATVDPTGRVILVVKETDAEAQLVAQESSGHGRIYNNSRMRRDRVSREASHKPGEPVRSVPLSPVADAVLDEQAHGERVEKSDVVSSSDAYGLGARKPE